MGKGRRGGAAASQDGVDREGDAEVRGEARGDGRGKVKGMAAPSISKAKKTRGLDELLGVGDRLIPPAGKLGVRPPEVSDDLGCHSSSPSHSSSSLCELAGIRTGGRVGDAIFADEDEDEVDDDVEDDGNVGGGHQRGLFGAPACTANAEQRMGGRKQGNVVEVIYTPLREGIGAVVRGRGIVGEVRRSERVGAVRGGMAVEDQVFDRMPMSSRGREWVVSDCQAAGGPRTGHVVRTEAGDRNRAVVGEPLPLEAGDWAETESQAEGRGMGELGLGQLGFRQGTGDGLIPNRNCRGSVWPRV